MHKKWGSAFVKEYNHKNKKCEIIDRIFCCSREGKRMEDKRDSEVEQPRPITRYGCLAHMKISNRKNGIFHIVRFVVEHAHELTTPKKIHLLKSQRLFTKSCAIEADKADRYGIKP